ncbi:MAG: ribonuclease HI family protein [bacterium]
MEKQLKVFNNPKVLNIKSYDFTVYTDGASRGNPGKSGAGIFVFDNKKKKEIIKESFYLDTKTNNQAEYLALALAAFLINENIKNFSEYSFQFLADSELLIKQMTNEYKIKDPILKKLKTLIFSILNDSNYNFQHIRREKNTKADELANKGIDSKAGTPHKFTLLLQKNNLFI